MDEKLIQEAIKMLKKDKNVQYIAALIENLANEVPCSECMGAGKVTGAMVKRYPCASCGGTGKKYRNIGKNVQGDTK